MKNFLLFLNKKIKIKIICSITILSDARKSGKLQILLHEPYSYKLICH